MIRGIILVCVCGLVLSVAQADEKLLKRKLVGMAYSDFKELFGKPLEERRSDSGAKGCPANPRGANPKGYLPPNFEVTTAIFAFAGKTTLDVTIVTAEEFRKLTGREPEPEADPVVYDVLWIGKGRVVKTLPGRLDPTISDEIDNLPAQP